MREFLKGLDLDKETIDTIMAEYGKNIQGLKEQIEDYKTKNIEYVDKVKELSEKSKDSSKIQEELETLKKSIADKEADEKAKKDDEVLTNNIITAFGDKKFINEYTKNAIISDIKKGLKDEKNSGKSAKDLFEEMTKNKSDIFENPNKIPDMEGMGETESMSKNVDVGEIKLNPMFKNYNK